LGFLRGGKALRVNHFGEDFLSSRTHFRVLQEWKSQRVKKRGDQRGGQEGFDNVFFLNERTEKHGRGMKLITPVYKSDRL